MSDEDDADKPLDVGMIPEHYSPVRSMWADAHGEAYTAFRTLAEAAGHPDAVLIMEADSGGQILATCPVRSVCASEPVLNQLLCDLEMIAWGPGGLSDSATPHDAQIYYELLPVGSGVGGGMGGGLVVDGVWVHPKLQKLGLAQQIEEIFAGARDRLSLEERGSPTKS
jgi:hypothetical protein